MKRFLLFSIVAFALLAMLAPACSPADPSASTKLTVACDATWPPFELVNEQTKQLDGYGPELMRAIAAKAGLDIEFVNVGFDSLLAGISQCQYDMAVSSITIKEERKKAILFSDPYYAAGQIVTVRKDSAVTGKDDLGGKTVGGQIGTTGIDEARKITGAAVKTYDDVGMAFQALIIGQLDAVIADNPVAQLYVNKNKDKLKTVGPVFTDEYFGIAICKKNAYLVPQINAALKALKDEGFLDSLSKKWIDQ